MNTSAFTALVTHSIK